MMCHVTTIRDNNGVQRVTVNCVMKLIEIIQIRQKINIHVEAIFSTTVQCLFDYCH